MQVGHLDDNSKSIEAFKSVSDERASECTPYLVKLLFQIVTSSLAKHSKCVSSEQVGTTLCLVMDNIGLDFFFCTQDHGIVEPNKLLILCGHYSMIICSLMC